MGLAYHFECPGCHRQATVSAAASGSLSETLTCPKCHRQLLMDEDSRIQLKTMDESKPDRKERVESPMWFKIMMISIASFAFFVAGIWTKKAQYEHRWFLPESARQHEHVWGKWADNLQHFEGHEVQLRYCISCGLAEAHELTVKTNAELQWIEVPK